MRVHTERPTWVFVAVERHTTDIDPNLSEDAFMSRYVVRVGADWPVSERQSAVRGSVMTRLRVQRRRRPSFPVIGLGVGDRTQGGAASIRAPSTRSLSTAPSSGSRRGTSPSPSSRGARASPSPSTTTSLPRRSTTSPASSSGRWGRCGRQVFAPSILRVEKGRYPRSSEHRPSAS